MPTAARRALRRVIDSARFTTHELADAAGVSVAQIQNASDLSGDRSDMAACRYELVSRWLCEHGETRLARAFISADYEITRRSAGTADGCLNAEMRRLIEVAGHLSEHHRSKDVTAFEACLSDLVALMDDLKAEGSLLR